jgi:iron complex outermembrane receptor protein
MKNFFCLVCFFFINLKIYSQVTSPDSTQLLEEVIIQQQKVTLKETSTQSVNVLKNNDLEKEKGKSLGEMLKNVNGINTLQTGPTIAKPIIQGNTGNRILILNNGIRQEGQQWGSEHAPEIDPFIANQITIIKGAESVRYGAEAIGGVILIEPASLFEKKQKIELDLVGFSNGRGGAMALNVGHSNKNWAYRVQGSLKKLGDFESANYVLSNTAMQERNFSMSIGNQFKNLKQELFFSRFDTDLAILSAAHIGNMNDLANAIDRQTPFVTRDFSYKINNPRQKVIHNLLKWQGEWKPFFATIQWQLGHQINQRQEFDIRSTVSSDIPTLNLELKTTTFDFVVLPKLKSSKIDTQLGFNLLSQSNLNIGFTGIRPILPQFLQTGFGFFSVFKYFQEKNEWEIGIRTDNKNIEVKKFDLQNKLNTYYFNFTNFTFTLGNIHYFNPNLVSKITFASAWRPPSVAEIFAEGVHHGSGVIEEGNINLVSEQGYKLTNTWQYEEKNKIKNKFSYQIDAYFQYIQNYIFSSPSQIRATIRGVFPVLRYRQTNAMLTGIDFSLQYQYNENLKTKLGGSFLYAKDMKENAPLILMPANRLKNEWTYTFKIRSQKIDFSLAGLYVFKQYFAPQVFTANQALQALFVGDISTPTTTFDFAPTPAGYFLVQTELNTKFKNISFGLHCENLFNQAYREYLNRFRYFADDLGRNISLRMKVFF